MKILLINPPYFLSEQNPFRRAGNSFAPLGLLSIAACARLVPETEVSVLDAAALKLSPEEIASALSGFSPDAAGISFYTGTFTSAVKTAAAVKKLFPRCLVVAGGPHATLRPQDCLASPDVDAVIKGEGEIPVCEIAAGKRLEEIANVVYKSGGKTVCTRESGERPDLAALPAPAFDLLDLKKYRPSPAGYTRLPVLSLVTSRGCPYRCRFCSKSVFGETYRFQPPEKTAQEMELLAKKYGAREISFQDDTFTANRGRVEKLCEILISRKLDITWTCMTRADLVDPALLALMRRAGCVSVAYGLDSVTGELAEKTAKDYGLAQAENAVRWTKEAGMETRAYYVFGYPGETRRTLAEAADAIMKISADFVFFAFAFPIPGTELYREAREKGLLLRDENYLRDKSDFTQPQVKLAGLSEAELSAFAKKLYRKYYLRPGYFWNRLKSLRSPSDAARCAKGFFAFLGWYGQAGGH